MFNFQEKEERCLKDIFLQHAPSEKLSAKSYLLVNTGYAMAFGFDTKHGVCKNSLYVKIGELTDAEAEVLLRFLQTDGEPTVGEVYGIRREPRPVDENGQPMLYESEKYYNNA